MISDRIVIRGGQVCDGTGSEPIARDILVDGGKIADVGEPGSFDAADAERIDATGLLTAPGFIDAHSHGDLAKLKYPENRSKLLQGVTTEVDGNCGSAPPARSPTSSAPRRRCAGGCRRSDEASFERIQCN